MRGIQQHGSAGVDGEAEEGHSRLTSVLARHQGERLWCCWHNLPLVEEAKVMDMTSVCEIFKILKEYLFCFFLTDTAT